MVIKGFIDYYPSKSCFVYPVYGNESNYYILDQHNELKKFHVDKEAMDYKFIEVSSHKEVPSNLQDMYAFKRNIAEIYFGIRHDIAQTLLLVSHILKDDLELYEEIAIFIKNSDISKEYQLHLLSKEQEIINHYDFLSNSNLHCFAKIGYEVELQQNLDNKAIEIGELYHSEEEARKFSEKRIKRLRMYKNRRIRLKKLIDQ